MRSRLINLSRVAASSMYRLHLPTEGADAAMPAGRPAAHLRRGKARAVASREPNLADLDKAEHGRIHDCGGLASLIFDGLELHVAHGADRDFGVLAPTQLDRSALGRKPLGDKTAEHGAGSPLLAGEDRLQLLTLFSIGSIINDDTDGAVPAGEVLGQVNGPDNSAAGQVDTVRLPFVDREGEGA